MIITAKYGSTCSSCSGSIRPGDQVEWTKGSPARHVRCSPQQTSGRSRSTPPRKPKAPRIPRRELQAGEQLIQRPTRSGAYDVGSTIHAGKISGGGGPDGCYWTITHQFFARSNEDNGQYDDLYCAHVRPATDAEVAPVLSRIAATKYRAAAEQLLVDTLRGPSATVEGDTGSLPPADETELSIVLGRKATDITVTDGGTTYALTATSVVSHHGGYYDDYRSMTRTVDRTEELALLIKALASNDAAALQVFADRAQAVRS